MRGVNACVKERQGIVALSPALCPSPTILPPSQSVHKHTATPTYFHTDTPTHMPRACCLLLALASAASGSLGAMVSTLLTASDEQAAYVCGILWEATSDLAVAEQVGCARGMRCACQQAAHSRPSEPLRLACGRKGPGVHS